MRGFKGTLYSEFLVLFVNLYIVYCHDLKAFDDTVLFKINWPGKSSAELLVCRYFLFFFSQLQKWHKSLFFCCCKLCKGSMNIFRNLKMWNLILSPRLTMRNISVLFPTRINRRVIREKRTWDQTRLKSWLHFLIRKAARIVFV